MDSAQGCRFLSVGVLKRQDTCSTGRSYGPVGQQEVVWLRIAIIWIFQIQRFCPEQAQKALSGAPTLTGGLQEPTRCTTAGARPWAQPAELPRCRRHKCPLRELGGGTKGRAPAFWGGQSQVGSEGRILGAAAFRVARETSLPSSKSVSSIFP